MNRILVALFIIYLSSQAIDALTLRNLCKDSIFQYKKFQVNSFLMVKKNYTLLKVGEYALDEELDFNEYFPNNKTTAEQINDLKDEYNSLIINIYSEDYLNYDSIEKIENEVENIKTLINKFDEHTNCVRTSHRQRFAMVIRKLNKGIELVQFIKTFTSNKIRPHMYTLAALRSLLSSLEPNENQSFVFSNDPVTSIYKKHLQQFERFYFFKASESYYSFDSHGIIEYSLNLPFNTKEYKEEPCVNGTKLPPFFSNKTQKFY